MKLRNKKTGAIYSIEDIDLGNNQDGIWLGLTRYTSLAELNEEWEDYEEEEKEYYTLNSSGQIWTTECFNEESIKDMKSIGNYFETKEEAEKAVKKLKAWKRLKDKGLEIKGWKFTPDMKHIKGNFIKIEAEIPYIQENMKDLDLLFGGEE